MNHFIYLHTNPITLEIFYVGQGTIHQGRYDRAYSYKSRSKWWNAYVNKHGKPDVTIIINNLSKENADLIERLLIETFGRKDLNEGSLVNLTNGGDGSGERSEKYKIEHSIRMSGKNHPMFGRKHNKEWRKNNSLSHMGVIPSEKTRKKMSESRKGGKRSLETRKKMSESLSGEKNPMFGMTGEKNPSSKLNWDKVSEIRKLYKSGNQSYRKLAKLFYVSSATIESIIKNKTWKIIE